MRIFRAITVVGLLYLMTVGGVWVWMRFGRDMPDARFSHLLLPSRWALHRRALGDHYIGLGERQLHAGEPVTAQHTLRAGVARSPANFRGRCLLAGLLATQGRHEAAARVFADAPPPADSKDLPATFALLFDLKRPDVVASLARRLLAQRSLAPHSRTTVALGAAKAAHLLGNYTEAARLLNESGAARLPDARLLVARIHWDQGYHDLALVEIRALIREDASVAGAHRQLREWLRATGATSELRHELLLARLAHPEEAGLRLEWLSLLRAEHSSHLLAETDAFLAEFAHDSPALLALAEQAAQHGDSALVRRIDQLPLATSAHSAAMAFLQAEAHIVAGDHAAALDCLRTTFSRPEQLTPRHQAVDASLRALAYFGLGDTLAGELHLRRFLTQPQLSAAQLRAVAAQLHRTGQSAHAQALLERAAAAGESPFAAAR